ncbi:MAG: metal-dependent transcriptional regulator [Bacilli bacterium]|nr:metal-dependent transcriptional regulator [Bacilli bacterium]
MRKISKSLEDYLETILLLELEGKPLHSIKIAKQLGVSKPAVTKALRRLAARGLVTKSSYSDVLFTKQGRTLAKKIYYRHVTLKKFLVSIGVDENTAERDCCKIEHVISEKTSQAIARLVNNKKIRE